MDVFLLQIPKTSFFFPVIKSKQTNDPNYKLENWHDVSIKQGKIIGFIKLEKLNWN